MPRDSTTTNLLPSILQKYRKVTLGVDILHINKIPYMVSIAKHIKFMQCLCIRDKTLKVSMKIIKKMKSPYVLREFKAPRSTQIKLLNHVDQN